MITIQDLSFLSTMGFTSLEIEIYQFLINNPPANGYTISKKTGRYKANVYNALASLKNKGAILINEGKGQTYKAVLPNNLVNQMQKRLGEIKNHAEKLTEKLETSGIDERIYQLSSVEQVYERYSTILINCREVALAELFPEPLRILRKDIENASSRGIKITVRSYKSDDLEGPLLIQSPFGTDTFKEHNGNWLSIFADGTQFLIAHLTPDCEKVRYAYWSQNPFLSWAFFSYISRDFLYYSLRPSITSSKTIEELQSILQSLEIQYPIGMEPGSRILTEFFTS
jgi:sugar-specific transcriptional regulator TrmB